jgi:nitroreductase
MSDVQENILNRRTIFRFLDKEVPNKCIENALEAARSAPCHKNTHPWKFYIMGDETRKSLIPTVEKLAKQKANTTDVGKIQLTLQRARDKILQPPVLIAVTSKLDSEDSFREEEDYAATVCSLHNMILSLWDQDIGSQWSTGSITRDPNTYSALSIAMDEERIIGFVKVGYPEVIPSKEKKPISEIRFYLP